MGVKLIRSLGVQRQILLLEVLLQKPTEKLRVEPVCRRQLLAVEVSPDAHVFLLSCGEQSWHIIASLFEQVCM